MAISDLKANQGSVSLTLDVIEKQNVREFEKFGKKGRVCNAICQDETGTISLTLWNDDIERVNTGDKIEIKNGYVGEFRGDLQLQTGKFGQLAVIGKSTPKEPKPAGAGNLASARQTAPKEKFEESENLVQDGELVKDDEE
mgnify:CR=1 FL=1